MRFGFEGVGPGLFMCSLYHRSESHLSISHRCPAIFFSTHIMSECHLRVFFPRIAFLGLTYPFLGGWGRGGGHLKVLKKVYRPRVIFKILGPT